MSYLTDHLKTCSYCSKGAKNQNQKPTISIKSASSYNKRKKLSELGAIIRGTSYAGLSPWLQTKTKGASSVENNFKRPGPIEREGKVFGHI
jgi:hypothetical protein